MLVVGVCQIFYFIILKSKLTIPITNHFIKNISSFIMKDKTSFIKIHLIRIFAGSPLTLASSKSYCWLIVEIGKVVEKGVTSLEKGEKGEKGVTS